MQHQLVTTSPARPSRAQIEPAALALLSRHSAGLLATARRYSATPEDAEDAYQRGVEILLTKAPTTRESELLPWMRTVLKHEAFAVRKSSGRMVLVDDAQIAEEGPISWTDEQAERYERLRVGAEAMAGLKPQEIRCLLLKAEGRSYQEICEITGWSYTKVNRCISEGRKAFLKRVAGIDSGAECERLAPLISKVVDGEASTEEMRAVRPHLKGCLACKATLREYRAAPSRLAGLVPPVVALAGGGEKVGLLGRLVERFGDLAGPKVAAVAAAGVMIAGGGAAGVGALHHDAPPVPAGAYAQTADPVPSSSSSPSSGNAPASGPPDPSSAAIEAVESPAPEPTASTEQAAPTHERAAQPEFDPGTATGESTQAAIPGATTQTQPNEFASDPVTSDPMASAPQTPAPSESVPTRSESGTGSAPAEFGP
jgi:RNA polymerase sigma factor (sigma-70 family)